MKSYELPEGAASPAHIGTVSPAAPQRTVQPGHCGLRRDDAGRVPHAAAHPLASRAAFCILAGPAVYPWLLEVLAGAAAPALPTELPMAWSATVSTGHAVVSTEISALTFIGMASKVFEVLDRPASLNRRSSGCSRECSGHAGAHGTTQLVRRDMNCCC